MHFKRHGIRLDLVSIKPGNLNQVLRRERSGIDLAVFFAIFFTTCQTDHGRWVSAKGSLGPYEGIVSAQSRICRADADRYRSASSYLPPRGMVMALLIRFYPVLRCLDDRCSENFSN